VTAAGGGSGDVGVGLARQPPFGSMAPPAAAARAVGSSAAPLSDAPAAGFPAGSRSSSASTAAGLPAGHARQSTGGGGGAGEAAEVVFLRQELEAMRSRLQTSEGEALYLRSRTEMVRAHAQPAVQQRGLASATPVLRYPSCVLWQAWARLWALPASLRSIPLLYLCSPLSRLHSPLLLYLCAPLTTALPSRLAPSSHWHPPPSPFHPTTAAASREGDV
jgi:hypothetical protein